MKGDHALSSVETGIGADQSVRTRCKCGWRSGWRRNRQAALRAVGDHVDAASTPMTEDRARAILADHDRGLHEDHFDEVAGCMYFFCGDARRFMDELAEMRAWMVWREAQARQDAVGGIT